MNEQTLVLEAEPAESPNQNPGGCVFFHSKRGSDLVYLVKELA